MSNETQSNPSSTRMGAFRAWLTRRGFPGAKVDPMAVEPLLEGRRPGAARPVYVEVSPATADPFPEPRTIPKGWDLSEMDKSR